VEAAGDGPHRVQPPAGLSIGPARQSPGSATGRSCGERCGGPTSMARATPTSCHLRRPAQVRASWRAEMPVTGHQHRELLTDISVETERMGDPAGGRRTCMSRSRISAILSVPMGSDQVNDRTVETRRGGFSGNLSVCSIGTASWNSAWPLADHASVATRLDADIAGTRQRCMTMQTHRPIVVVKLGYVTANEANPST
jgi:hypothetical protein